MTISPPAQLSATVVTSTSVTVSAADYNEDYTVSVVATNCAGNSTAEEYSFRVGELVVVVCVVRARVCVYIVKFNEFHPHIGFVVCYPLTFIVFPGGCPLFTDLISNSAFGPVTSRVQGSTVTLQCDPGYVSDVDMLTCEGTLMWSPDPGTVVCRPLTPPPPTTEEYSLRVGEFVVRA